MALTVAELGLYVSRVRPCLPALAWKTSQPSMDLYRQRPAQWSDSEIISKITSLQSARGFTETHLTLFMQPVHKSVLTDFLDDRLRLGLEVPDRSGIDNQWQIDTWRFKTDPRQRDANKSTFQNKSWCDATWPFQRVEGRDRFVQVTTSWWFHPLWLMPVSLVGSGMRLCLQAVFLLIEGKHPAKSWK